MMPTFTDGRAVSYWIKFHFNRKVYLIGKLRLYRLLSRAEYLGSNNQLIKQEKVFHPSKTDGNGNYYMKKDMFSALFKNQDLF